MASRRRAVRAGCLIATYVGPKGRVGAYLDERPDWRAVANLLEDAYRRVALSRPLTRLDER